jgi:hypothetical protein
MKGRRSAQYAWCIFGDLLFHAALMAGRYPMRHGLQTQVIFPSRTYGLPAV